MAEYQGDNMSDIQFECPKCGHNLVVDSEGAGMTVSCPECSEQIEIPGLPTPVSDLVDHLTSSEPASDSNQSESGVTTQDDGVPDGVRTAVMLLYIAIGIGVVRGIMESMGIIDTVIVLGVLSLIIHLIGKGHNWARITYILLFAIGTPFSISPLIQSIKANLLSGMMGVGQICVQICACIILVRAPVVCWYRKSRQSKIKDDTPPDNVSGITHEDRLISMGREIRALRRNMRNVTLGFSIALLVTVAWLDKNEITKDAGTEIRARRYYVVDSHGTERALLGINDDGSTGLSLLDKHEHILAAIGSDPDGTSVLSMYDSRGKMRTMMGVGPTGSALSMHDANGVSRVSLEVQNDGVPLLHMKDSDGHPRAQLMVDDIGTPSITYFSNNRKILLSLWAHDDAPYGLQLWSRQNDPGVSLVLESDGRPVLSLAGAGSSSRIWAGIDEKGRPSMAMVGNGRPIWSEP